MGTSTNPPSLPEPTSRRASSSTAPKGNLPRPLTSFIGREQEVAAVCALLSRDDIRLTTLVGPGGVGKTRLALKVADRMVDAFADGIWFVPLASIHDPVLVPGVIASTVNTVPNAQRSVEENLVARLHDLRTMLVLDNFEQILDAAVFVSDLLSACPGLSVLVTSRSNLRISGEQVYSVPPMVVPRNDVHADPTRLVESDSIQLFVDRARSTSSSFALTAQNMVAVTELCDRLDGLPLAIELAAARVDMFSPAELVRRLGERLTFLTDGARDQPSRLQSLRESIGWSYDLLSPADQVLFRRLGVFAGPWTIDAVEAVVYEADDPSIHSVVDGVGSLLDKHLVRRQVSPNGESQYLLLETVREYAAELLDASNDVDAVRRRHTDYLLAIAVESAFGIFRPDGAARYALIDFYTADLWRALSRLEAQHDVENFVELSRFLAVVWYPQLGARKIPTWLLRAIELARATSSPNLGRALISLAIVGHMHGDEDTAWTHVQEGLARVIEQDDPLYTFLALTVSGLIAQRRDAGRQAAAFQQEALAMLSELREIPWIPFAESTVLGHLGNNAITQGNMERARDYFGRALELQTSLGFEPGTSHYSAGHAIAGLGDAARGEHNVEEALSHYQHALRLAHEIHDFRGSVYAIGGVAATLSTTGQWERAARLFGAAESLFDRAGIHFQLEIMERQRGLGLPEPWFRADEPFGSGQHIHDALWADRKIPFPPIPDPVAAAAQWDAGRGLSLDEAVADALAAELATPAFHDPRHGLSAREMEVLRHLVDGKSDAAIAADLFISRRTAATHVRHIYDKLGVSSRAAAAAYAVRNGLV